MLARVKKLYKNWKADRQQLRELTIKLEGLLDPTFLFRAEHDITFSKHDKYRALFIYGIDMGKL
jgi:hypothetical protein